MVVAPTFADTRTYLFPHTEARYQRAHLRQSFQMPHIQAHLVGEIGDDLIIAQPLPISIERDEDQSYIVSDDIFLVYGDGENTEHAIKDYVASLIEFYNILKDSKTDPFDQEQFVHLESYIQTRPQRGYDAIQTSTD